MDRSKLLARSRRGHIGRISSRRRRRPSFSMPVSVDRGFPRLPWKTLSGWACDMNASKHVMTTHHVPNAEYSGLQTADTGTHRILVIGSDSADVVRFVGGWICDRALSGWRVTVALKNTTDTEPIVILGAKPIPFEAVAPDLPDVRWPCALAMAGDIFAEDSKVNRVLSSCRREALPDVMVWGESVQVASAPLVS